MLQREDQAIVLKTHEYGESDLIVSFFSQKRGRWQGIAKGARRSRKRFGGALEIGSHVRVMYEEKPHRELAFLKEARLVLINPLWRTAWETIVVAGFVLELVYKFTPEHQESLQKFLLLENFLKSLQANIATSLLFEFQHQWLELSGWGDNLDECGICGHVWKRAENALQRQAVFDHYWRHLLDKPLVSRGLLDEAVLV